MTHSCLSQAVQCLCCSSSTVVINISNIQVTINNNNTWQERWFEHFRGCFYSDAVSEDGRCFNGRCSSISSAREVWTSSHTIHWRWVHTLVCQPVVVSFDEKGGPNQNKRWGFSCHTPVALHGYAINWWQVRFNFLFESPSGCHRVWYLESLIRGLFFAGIS